MHSPPPAESLRSAALLALLLTACAPEAGPGPDAPAKSLSGNGGANWFTGDVASDFTSSSVVIITDPGGVDVGIPLAGGSSISGHDIEYIALDYDAGTDVLSIGFATYGVGSDVDGDGDASFTTPWLSGLGGSDVADVGGLEAFVFGLDIDEDGTVNVLAGVPGDGVTDLSGYTVSTFSGSVFSLGLAFNTPLPGHTGGVFGSPTAAAPHHEFTITDFSQLATTLGLTDTAPSFGAIGFMGSFQDAGIGEDNVPGAGTFATVCFDMDGDGFSTCDGDCDDDDASIFPGASETCDGLDNDCDGTVDEGFDADADGYSTCDGDCDDADATINPGATETCDSIDNDCDGTVDEGFDADADGYSTCSGDCDDADATINPGAAEACDGLDNDCDGAVDEGFDADADGYSTCDGDCDDADATINPGATETCDSIDNDCDGAVDEGFDADADGYSACGGDCDDADAAINPGATETCDSIDNDCDGAVDEGFDADGDGVSTCDGDCDDADATAYPGATETCDSIDNDCDGAVDEGFDADGDGVSTCDGDCDDADATAYPGATETCDSIDNDCDGAVDEGFDADGDGVSTCDGDCDDADATAYPGATETCDSIDNDCDGAVDEGFDADGDGVSTCDGDCDDADATAYPGATETCDSIDNDCDGAVDEGFDADGDGVSTCDGDCDDADATAYPGAPEDCTDGVNNDCDGDLDSADAECVCDTYTLGAADDYNVFVFEDYVGGLDVEGHVAAGLDLDMSGFSIGLTNPGGDAAVAGDTLILTSGTVYGDGWYGVSESVASNVTFTGGSLQSGSPIDFATAEADLQAASAALSGLAATGTTTVYSWGGIALSGTDPTLNVFEVSGTDLASCTYLSLSAPAGSVALINVDGASITAGNFSMALSGVDQTTTLFHFYDATALTFSSLAIEGSVLAPYADVVFNNGDFNGNFVSLSLTGTAEGHWYAWDGEVEVCP